MKKFILIILITVKINAWEVNTHRAIDRSVIGEASNLNDFVKNSGIKNINYKVEV